MEDLSNKYIKCINLQQWEEAQKWAFNKGFSWTIHGSFYYTPTPYSGNGSTIYPMMLFFNYGNHSLTYGMNGYDGDGGYSEYHLNPTVLNSTLSEGVVL